MLQKGLDRQALPELGAPPAPVEHDNIRGAGYYADPQATLFGEVAG
jgi:hypothetical protein